MRYIEENLGTKAKKEPPSQFRSRLEELEVLVPKLAELYQELGLQPLSAWRSALADFAGDFPGEVAALNRVRREA